MVVDAWLFVAVGEVKLLLASCVHLWSAGGPLATSTGSLGTTAVDLVVAMRSWVHCQMFWGTRVTRTLYDTSHLAVGGVGPYVCSTGVSTIMGPRNSVVLGIRWSGVLGTDLRGLGPMDFAVGPLLVVLLRYETWGADLGVLRGGGATCAAF